MRWSQWASLNQQTLEHTPLAMSMFVLCQNKVYHGKRCRYAQKVKYMCSPCVDNQRSHFLDYTAASAIREV